MDDMDHRQGELLEIGCQERGKQGQAEQCLFMNGKPFELQHGVAIHGFEHVLL